MPLACFFVAMVTKTKSDSSYHNEVVLTVTPNYNHMHYFPSHTFPINGDAIQCIWFNNQHLFNKIEIFLAFHLKNSSLCQVQLIWLQIYIFKPWSQSKCFTVVRCYTTVKSLIMWFYGKEIIVFSLLFHSWCLIRSKKVSIFNSCDQLL